MGRFRRFKLDRVSVQHLDDRRGTWDWVQRSVRRPVSGTESLYKVVDENYDRLNSWVFVVQQPSKKGPIIVRPHDVPGKAVWGSIGRTSLVFNRTTRSPYRNKWYCKLALADPSGNKTKFLLRQGEQRILPTWMKSLRHRMKLKGTVAGTRGNDGRHVVLLVRPADHVGMIRIFFALKVWVLGEGYQLPPLPRHGLFT